MATTFVSTDQSAFVGQLERHRRELHVHCYRMLGSFEKADDLVQDTFLRAWRRRESFDGGSWLRAGLYRIATTACLDALRSSSRRMPSLSSFAELPRLQPYPDRLLDEIVPRDTQPDAVVVARATIELAYLATIQLLPPRQRAALILSDVLGWSMSETARVLDTTVAAANSVLQRARATMQAQLPAGGLEASATEPTKEERALLERFIDAHERADAAAAIALLRDDVRITMPPHPFLYEGLDVIVTLLDRAIGHKAIGDWRLVPTAANRQPTAAGYLRAPDSSEYRAFKLDVLHIERGVIAGITTFDASLFRAFGLPLTL